MAPLAAVDGGSGRGTSFHRLLDNSGTALGELDSIQHDLMVMHVEIRDLPGAKCLKPFS